MANLFSTGLELNSNAPGMECTAAAGTPTVQSTTKRSGVSALQITGLSSGIAKGLRLNFAAAAGNGPFFFRTYFRVGTAPSAANTIIQANDTNAFTTQIASIELNNDRTLQLRDEDGTIGSPSSAIPANDFEHYIELKLDLTGGAGAHIVEAKLDGSVFATSSARSLSAGILTYNIGGNLNAEAQTAGDWYFDDVVINDSTGSFQTGYPGVGELIILRPSAAGDNANWTRGGTDSGANWSQVEEVTPDDVTTYVQSNTSGVIDDYNLEDTPAAIASNDVINAVLVGIRAAVDSAAGTDPDIVLRIKASAGGTVEESAALDIASTSYFTNNDGVVLTYKLVLYDLPGASTTAWTKADLDSAQVGVRESVSDTNFARVSALWVYVDAKPAPDVPLVEPEFPVIDEITYDEEHNYSGWLQQPLAENVQDFQPLAEATQIDETYDRAYSYSGWVRRPQIDSLPEPLGPPPELPQIDEAHEEQPDYYTVVAWQMPPNTENFQPLPEVAQIDETYDEEHTYEGYVYWQTPEDIQDFQPLAELPQVDETYDEEHTYEGWLGTPLSENVEYFQPLAELPQVDETYDEEHTYEGYVSWQTPEDIQNFQPLPEFALIDETYDEEHTYEGWLGTPLSENVEYFQPLPEFALIDETYDEEHTYEGYVFWQTPEDIQNFQPLPEFALIDETYYDKYDYSGSVLVPTPDDVVIQDFQPLAENLQVDETYDYEYQYDGWQLSPLNEDRPPDPIPTQYPVIDSVYDIFYGHNFDGLVSFAIANRPDVLIQLPSYLVRLQLPMEAEVELMPTTGKAKVIVTPNTEVKIDDVLRGA